MVQRFKFYKKSGDLMSEWDKVWKSLKLPWKLNLENYYDWRYYIDLEPYLKEGKGKKILEVGCAPGRFMEFFRRFGFDVYGVEITESGIKATVANLKLLGVRDFDIIRGDANALPFGDSSFDIVFNAGLIEHFEDPMPLLEEFKRVLKDCGLLITYVPNLAYPNLRRLERLVRGSVEDWHRPLKLNDLISYYDVLGLEVLETRYSGLCIIVGYRFLPKIKILNKLINFFTGADIFIVGKKLYV